MATTDNFNLDDNVKAERKLLVTAVMVDSELEIVGAGIEESTIEFNPEITTKTDILGVTETTVDKLAPKQSFSPFTIRGGSKLAFKLFDIWKRKAWSELSNFEVVLAYGFLKGGTTGNTFAAEKHEACTISINSIGGSAYVDFPIEIHYSNKVTHGTVDKLTSGLKFTASTTT